MIYRQGSGLTKRIGGVAPTKRADGTPLAASDIANYVRFSTYDSGLVTEEDVDLVGGYFDGILAVDDMAPGIYEY
jgi:hypothetical protein